MVLFEVSFLAAKLSLIHLHVLVFMHSLKIISDPAMILDFIDQNKSRYEDELKAFLRIPSISTSPEHTSEVRRCAEFVADELKRIGLQNVGIYETAGHPVV